MTFTWLRFHYDPLSAMYSQSSQTSKMVPFAKKLKSSKIFMRLWLLLNKSCQMKALQHYVLITPKALNICRIAIKK